MRQHKKVLFQRPSYFWNIFIYPTLTSPSALTLPYGNESPGEGAQFFFLFRVEVNERKSSLQLRVKNIAATLSFTLLGV
jgi:hypothetical protein